MTVHGAGGLDDRGLPPGYRLTEAREVSPRDVRAALAAGSPGPVVIDVRTVEERRAACIAGTVHIPMGEVESRLQEIESLSDGGAREVVVHCHHGSRSLKVAMFLKGRGIDARSMAGGIDLWSRDIDPAVPRYG